MKGFKNLLVSLTCLGTAFASPVDPTQNTKAVARSAIPNVMDVWRSYGSKPCLDDTKAQYFVNGFKDLLEYTSYKGSQGPPGRGYHYNTSAAILAEDFQDQSDSINWMAGIPLGAVTFANKTAFDYGQGILQPELQVTTLNIWHSCNAITWRWNAITSTKASVRGINQMVLDDTLSKIKFNYAEFDNAAWLYSFGLQCKATAS